MAAITNLSNETSTNKYEQVVGDSTNSNIDTTKETNKKTFLKKMFEKIDTVITTINTHKNQEEIEDIVGAMFDGGTETRISATYDDDSGKINLIVDDMSDDNNTTYSISCVDGDNSDEEKIRITASTGGTDDIVLEAGTGLTIARNADKITFTNTVTDTTYTVGDGGLTQNNFTDADHTKLNGIEDNATADQTQSDINALGITQVGTISSGTWQGTAIGDSYISSASTWNAKQPQLTFGLASGNTLRTEEAIAENDILLGGSAHVKGRTYAQLKSDLSLNNVENTALSTFTGTTNITTLASNIANSTTFDEDLTITTIPEATSDTDKFLVSDSGLIKYVTGNDLRSYIGAGTSNLALGTTGSTALAGNTAVGDANVQSDWNASSGDAQILNKPNVQYTSAISTGNNGLVPATGSDGEFLKHNGTFGQVAYSNLSGTPTIPTDYVTNNADDEMQGTLTIDKNNTATSSSTTNGIFIDFDHTGISASGQQVTNQGLKIDLNSNSPTHVGTVNNYGIRNTIIAGTSGTQFNYGIIQSVTGGDTNIGIYQAVDNGGPDLVFQDSANANNYFTLKTDANAETTITTLDNSGASGHLNIEPDGHVEFDGCGVGFDLVTPTFNAADTNVDFKTGNKQMVTLTDNIADLNLTFPATSGNFTLLLKQDGSGNHTMAADGWLAFESDGTAATVPAVKFPGGTAPTLTTAANHVDIVSFFWDADNQVCYGVASLDFQD